MGDSNSCLNHGVGRPFSTIFHRASLYFPRLHMEKPIGQVVMKLPVKSFQGGETLSYKSQA